MYIYIYILYSVYVYIIQYIYIYACIYTYYIYIYIHTKILLSIMGNPCSWTDLLRFAVPDHPRQLGMKPLTLCK